MSSSPIDIVKVFFGTFSLMGADKAGQYLADDFQLIGMTDALMDKSTWIGFLNALKNAIPDLKIRLSAVEADSNEVRFTQIGVGTHRASMDMSSVGLGEIPPSGELVTFPSSQWLLTVTEGKITRGELLSPASPETGLPGMLKAFAMDPVSTG